MAFVLVFSGYLPCGCSKAYYGAMEKVGFHKRDILVDRVEAARDAQHEAQEQFKSALDEFSAVVRIEDTDLKNAFETLNMEYEASEGAANTVSERIDRVESVAEALFEEWEDELALYQSIELRNSSKRQLQETKDRYKEMLGNMHQAEKSMSPVLRTFRDNVLFLKHNLNAQAIGSLRMEFASLKKEIDALIRKMNTAIESSDQFISNIKHKI
jgi:predicted  nucleic acid-binding Zn-ribbon protein